MEKEISEISETYEYLKHLKNNIFFQIFVNILVFFILLISVIIMVIIELLKISVELTNALLEDIKDIKSLIEYIYIHFTHTICVKFKTTFIFLH